MVKVQIKYEKALFLEDFYYLCDIILNSNA